MSHRSLAALAVSALIVLAGCSSSSGSAAPSSGAAAPSSGAAAPSSGASACKETTTAGAVAASIVDFAFQPTSITAKVGDVVTFTNTGATAHTATLDDGTCTTPNIAPTKSDGLTFTVAGTYPFHCSIHTQMKATIVVS